ncbi:MAG: tetratricopeptide repeat protein, partial [Myxococcota bacterium]
VREASKALAISEFLSRLIVAGKPENSVEQEPTIRAAIQSASELLDNGVLDNEPEARAALHSTLGSTYLSLGDRAEARRQVDAVKQMEQKGLLSEGPELAEALAQSGKLFGLGGDMGRATEEVERARKIANRFGSGLTQRRIRALVLNEQASAYRDAGRHAEAIKVFRETLELRRSLVAQGFSTVDDIANTLNQIGHLLGYRGAYDKAEESYQEALALCVEEHGRDHPRSANVMHNLGWLDYKQENCEDALRHLDEAYVIRKKGLGPTHMALANQRVLRSSILLETGRFKEAEDVLAEAIVNLGKAWGPEHGFVLRNRLGQIEIFWKTGRTREAVALGQTLSDKLIAISGENHVNSSSALMYWAPALLADGQVARAIEVAKRARAISLQLFGDGSTNVERADAFIKKACASAPSVCPATESIGAEP